MLKQFNLKDKTVRVEIVGSLTKNQKKMVDSMSTAMAANLDLPSEFVQMFMLFFTDALEKMTYCLKQYKKIDNIDIKNKKEKKNVQEQMLTELNNFILYNQREDDD